LYYQTHIMYIDKESTMSKKISVIRYSPFNGNDYRTSQLVECYRDVFAYMPWNEWLQCSGCHTYWGKSDMSLLASWKYRHCGEPLVDFWSREQVISDLYNNITPDASSWIAMDSDRVVGFCLGYPVTVTDLETKLGISLSFVSCTQNLTTLAYQDDLCVLESYRGRHIAKMMIARRLDDFLLRQLTYGVVRTRQFPEPSITYLWYTQRL